MSNKKRIRRRKFNFFKFLVFALFIYILVYFLLGLFKLPIKNIVVLNNNYISDEEIIEKAGIQEYPSFYKTLSFKLEKKIKNIKLIKDVNVKKKFGRIIEINVDEYKVLYLIRSNGLYILEDGTELDIDTTLSGIPILINYVPEEVNKKLNEKMALLDLNVISKISEIEYSPTSYDEERFLFYMNDSNLVYITLNKINEFNKYNTIKTQLEGKTGILYLDSGNYFEIKE